MKPSAIKSVVSGRVFISTTALALALFMVGARATGATTNVYEWTFDAGDLSATLGQGLLTFVDPTKSGTTSFGTTGGGVPHIGGHPATFMHVPAFVAKEDGYLVTLSQSSSNGGGLYINQYTVIMDVLLPGALNWTALFNTDPGNLNDADWYVAPDGSIGIGDLGYTSAGLIAPNTWYRLAFTADLGAGVVTYYLNGSQVFQRTGASLLDDRFSLYSTNDNLPSLLLFNEGDFSGNYTHELYVAGIAVTDRALLATEISLLGGPHPEGIYARRLHVDRSGTNVVVNWNAAPNLRLQQAFSFNPIDWQNVPATLGASSYTNASSHTNLFYRLLWQ